jgi:hypothetical protein
LDYSFMDIVVAADHEQGTFKAGVKVVFRAGSKSPKRTCDFTTGEIECKKDAAELLRKTLMPLMNEQLKQMVFPAEIATGSQPDGTLQLYKPQEGSIHGTFTSVGEKRAEEDTLLHSIPFHIVVSGDLAWYVMTLGKENSAGHWCWLCQLRKLQWQTLDDEGRARVGDSWTIKKIEDIAVSNTESSTTVPVVGIKAAPLLDCIGIDRYMCPVLHLLLCLANDVPNNLFTYVNERNGLEDVPQPVKDARTAVFQTCEEYSTFTTALMAWDRLNGGHLTTIRLSRAQIIQWLHQPRGSISIEQKRDMQEAKKSISTEISTLVKARKELENAAKPVKIELGKAKKELEVANAAFNTIEKRVRARIEEILKRYGID